MLSGLNAPGEAKLKYGPADYEVIKSGQFVICAITQQKIPLAELRYWSVDDQEPYIDAAAAFTKWKRKNGYEDA